MFSVRCDQRHHTLSFVANKRKRKKGRKKAGRARERERRKSEREREKKRKSERERKKKDERCIYKMHIFNYLTQYKCDDFLHQVMRNSILLQFKNMEFHILT